VQPFVSEEAYLLWKLITKGEKLEQRYENTSWEEVEDGQRGSNIKEIRRIKILGQREAHK
jgi:hypothetical protein